MIFHVLYIYVARARLQKNIMRLDLKLVRRRRLESVDLSQMILRI